MTIPTYDGLVYFEDWLEAEGYYREIYDEEEKDRLYDEFCEWAEENGLIPEYC